MKQRVAGFVAALVFLAMLTVSACNGSGDTPEDGDVTGDGDDADDIEIVEETEEDGDLEPDMEPDVEVESDGDTEPDGDADLADPDPDAEPDIDTTGEPKRTRKRKSIPIRLPRPAMPTAIATTDSSAGKAAETAMQQASASFCRPPVRTLPPRSAAAT